MMNSLYPHKKSQAEKGLIAPVKWLLATLLVMQSLVVSATSLTGARIWNAPDHTRLVLDVDSQVDHHVSLLGKPDRLVLDIKNTELKTGWSGLHLKSTPIKRIRSARRNKKDLRIVLDLSDKIKPKSFMLAPSKQYGNRLVVDLYGTASKARPAVAESTILLQGKRDIIVMIDPGHGGEDPGAIGPSRTREKDVVLSIAKRLKKLIDAQTGYRAYLTRKSDYYIGLRHRTVLARKKNADMFISIHADAFETAEAKGASVFALSRRGATSEAARWLAKKENSADLIGGVGSVSLEDKDDVLAGVLLDLSMTASLKASLNVGQKVLDSLSGMAKLHKRHVEQAGFMVLKSPDIPSILVETGFISNPVEARRLRSGGYQQKIAQAIQKGVRRYFEQTPPPGTLLAWSQATRNSSAKRIVSKLEKVSAKTASRKVQSSSTAKKVDNKVVKKSRKSSTRKYVVKRGDTLSHIAMRYNISMRELIRLNRLSSKQVNIGQRLLVPAS